MQKAPGNWETRIGTWELGNWNKSIRELGNGGKAPTNIFKTLFSCSSIASKVFLKTQFHVGSVIRPLVHHICHHICLVNHHRYRFYNIHNMWWMSYNHRSHHHQCWFSIIIRIQFQVMQRVNLKDQNNVLWLYCCKREIHSLPTMFNTWGSSFGNLVKMDQNNDIFWKIT